MAYANAYQQYLESQVLTASKGKLLLMTYDGAIRFIGQAKIHMAAREYEAQNTCIIKAQRLILELMMTLDAKVAPDLAHRLMLLYEYMFNRLVEANVTDKPDVLDEVHERLTELRSTWAEADLRASSEAGPAVPARFAAAAA